MAQKYTYSRTLRNAIEIETFTAAEFNSFDEAKKAVDKGIRDRKLELKAEVKSLTPNIPQTTKSIDERNTTGGNIPGVQGVQTQQ